LARNNLTTMEMVPQCETSFLRAKFWYHTKGRLL
jgi:hypothetical protein